MEILEDHLMTRLDRLGPAKEVIQIGSVIGCHGTYKAIARERATIVEIYNWFTGASYRLPHQFRGITR
jgi:hypothetical protein